jgi:PAS domain S-box-containing protein
VSPPLRVLILEHDQADVELCTEALRRERFDLAVTTADGPDAFAAALDAGPVDVVLADYRLPAWTGMDAFEVLRRRGLDVPFILVTGTLGEERAVECMRRGVTDYVLKLNLDRLGPAVQRALSERTLRTEAGRQAELIRKLKLAVDQSPASVIVTDTHGTIEYVNRRFEESTGYAAAEALGGNPSMLQSGQTPEDVYRSLWATITAGRVWNGTLINRRKNGEICFDRVRIAPLRDDDGVVTHYVASQEDVTAQLAAERQLSEQEFRLRQVTDHIREVVFIADGPSQAMLYVSPAFDEIWGRSRDALYASPAALLQMAAPEDRQALADHMAVSRRGQDPGEIEYRVVRPDGAIRWVRTHVRPVFDGAGNFDRVVGVAQDITARKQAELALAESERRARKLLEAAFAGIVIHSDGIIRDASAGYAELLGYEPSELIGRPVAELVAEESRAEVDRRIALGIEEPYEHMACRKDGRKLWLQCVPRNHVIEGRAGRMTAVRDITHDRQTEEQRRQSQKMEAVGRLAGGVAHDFNNLLTVIGGHVELILENRPATDPLHDDLTEIQRAAAGAAALTRQLLAFSRQQVVEPQVIRLDHAVEATARMLRRMVGEDVHIVIPTSDEPVFVRIDPGQLDQVLMNLAVNARDAMPDGGEFVVETSITELDAAYADAHWPTRAGHYALLAVSDSGAGMDAETQAHLFEPFYTTKPVGRGTGLGLATVYGIVKQADGFIWVYSEPGEGTTFKIYLPLIEPGPTRSPAPGPRPHRDGTEVVLLTEDEPAVRTMTRISLERHGYTVLEAPDGASALALAQRHRGPIHLLLTDVVMPGMGGPALARQIAALRPDVRVLFMSGYTSDIALRHGVTDEGVAYIQKPFTPAALARKVRDTLDG